MIYGLIKGSQWKSKIGGSVLRYKKTFIQLTLPICIYLIFQYVGKSVTPFAKRHSNHKQEIKHGKGGLGQHYGPEGRCSYQDIRITLIEQVEEGNRVQLARRDEYWQHQLRAFIENGGNAHSIKKEII